MRSDVVFFVGGGNDGVRAIVQDAEKANCWNVFGVIDRDLRPSNRGDWLNPSKTFRTFVLPVHEVENYLLDPAALAACPYNIRQQTTDQIEGFMLAHAGRFCWWMACCEVVADLKRRFRDSFMNNPKYPHVSGEAEAVDHVLTSAWYQNLGQEIATSTPADVRRLITEQHQLASERLIDGSWRAEFAGKEILLQVGTQIVDWTKATKPTRAEFESDLAKEVADWQVRNGAIPADLVELRLALKERIKRPTKQA